MANVIYKDPIKVICIKAGNTKLVKGAIYSATSIYEAARGGIKDKYVYLEGVGTYNVINFTLLDKSSLSKLPPFGMEQPVMLEPKLKDYTGQFVKCRYSSGKSMKSGEIYYVEQQFKTEKYDRSCLIPYGMWNTTSFSSANKQKYYEYKLKIRGIRNKVTPYHFAEIPLIEQRLIKLKNLKGEKIKTGEQTRKFLLYTEKEKTSILFDMLSRVLIDVSKIDNLEDTKVSIPDLMIKKGSKYALVKEDIESFLKDNIGKLIKPFYNL